MTGFPTGYAVRRPTLDDVDAILAVVHASDVVAVGYPDFDRSEVVDALTAPGFDPDRDSWVVHDPAGRLVGWGYLEAPGRGPEEFCEAYAHPAEPFAVQAPLMRLLLGRVGELAARRVLPEITARAGAVPTEERWIAILTDLGFTFDRQHARMRIELTGAERTPTPPAGIRVRSPRPGDETDLRTLHAVIQEAFADTNHPLHGDFAAFAADVGRTAVAWDEWLIADVDGVPAAALRSAGQSLDNNEGWVKSLGVRAAYRGRGLGGLLLRTAFATYAAKGRVAAGLGVDTTNPTGAFRLYESVGMRPAYRANIYRLSVAAANSGSAGSAAR